MAAVSGTQRFLQLLLPWMAEAMEADSRSWVTTCACGHTFSIWDIGGIRYRATGDSGKLLRCPACLRFALRRLRRADEGQQQK